MSLFSQVQSFRLQPQLIMLTKPLLLPLLWPVSQRLLPSFFSALLLLCGESFLRDMLWLLNQKGLKWNWQQRVLTKYCLHLPFPSEYLSQVAKRFCLQPILILLFPTLVPLITMQKDYCWHQFLIIYSFDLQESPFLPHHHFLPSFRSTCWIDCLHLSWKGLLLHFHICLLPPVFAEV